ncbi:hypothetical protein FBY14_105152 [Azospirillum brasilense]|nr:hypothetical protein FBY14_105152 [Azospirillum brasilense]
MNNIDDVLSFGSVEADNDDLLLECFEDHDAYISAKNHRRFLIVGRKGSGKTAIFRKISSEKEYNRFSYTHSFSDYPWFYHDKQKKNGIPEGECYRYSWEYLILISISKIIVNEDASPWSDDSLEGMSRLEAFIKDTYGSTSPELNRIFAPETVLRVKPSLTAGWGPVRGTLSVDQVNVEHLPSVVYEVNQALTEAVIRCLNPNHDYYICFDELDRGFVADDENYKSRLKGLLIAVRDFNKKVRSSGKKMSCIVFLRDDILRHLKFEDSNKIMEDFSSIIEWDKTSTSKTLKGIMERRFSRALGIPTTGAWDIVFDESQQMPGRQSKYQHIIDRTFKRPRDIIKFSNEILRVYKSDLGRGGKFANKHITEARNEYSKYVKKELIDEIRQYIPYEESAFDMLRIIGATTFTIERFKAAHKHISENREVIPAPSIVLRQLYNFSIIGFLKVGGAGGGSEWVWKYEDTDAEYDERATIFRTHSSLKEVLGLKLGRATADGENVADLADDYSEIEPDEA